MSGVDRIAKERKRQISVEGWTSEHDDTHDREELAWAAICFAAPDEVKKRKDTRYSPIGGEQRVMTSWVDPWPWGSENKQKRHVRVRQLEIAGALIAAEMDRLERLK